MIHRDVGRPCMIRLPSGDTLAPVEQFGLDLVVDLARLLPVDDPIADVVRLELSDDETRRSPREWIAAEWGVTIADGAVRLPRAALRQLAEIAGAVDEQRSRHADRHGRVPTSDNPLVRDGVERRPVVSDAARHLATCVRRAAGRRRMSLVAPWPEGRRWAVALTHDLDVVALWPAFTARRLAELIAGGHAGQAGQVMWAAVRALAATPVLDAVNALVALEARLGVRATWFVICGTPTLATVWAGDVTYRPESPSVRRILDVVTGHRHAIGLHGSFATSTETGAFGAQRARLAHLTTQDALGVRQHFLRLRPGVTHRAMVDAGFTYDASAGFPDRNGFRLGVADIIPAWDVETNRRLPIDEIPFAWMDRALSKYQGVEDPRRWIADGLELAAACRDAGGLWVGVWHPNLTPALGFPGAPAAYAELLSGLLADAPYVGTLDELDQWRRWRRSVRAHIVPTGGDIVLSGEGAGRVLLAEMTA